MSYAHSKHVCVRVDVGCSIARYVTITTFITFFSKCDRNKRKKKHEPANLFMCAEGDVVKRDEMKRNVE